MSRSTLFSETPTKPLVAPSILSADFTRLGEQCQAVLDAGADLLHLDVMDGHFVPNLTMGPAICASLRRAIPSVFLDVHLMVMTPSLMVGPFADAGADHVTFHIECEETADEVVDQIHSAGMSAGISLRPKTTAAAVERIVGSIDLVLVMTVEPGFAGQDFMPGQMTKARQLRSMLRPDQRLEVDGGVNAQTARQCRDAGCDVLVAASAIFGAKDYASAIASIRGTSPVPSGS